ncbi:MAG TPA: DUF1501 domain-containing protein [Actinomycetota bacterium]|nr:DUF1501 domain-containing protein [Actinomycetota bacterium]
MGINRRDFLAGSGALAGAHLLAPVVFRAGAAFAQEGPDPSTRDRRRLLVIFQHGGNDGLNTVVPMDDVPGAPRYSVYRKVRPSIAYLPEDVLALDRAGDADHKLGLNPKLQTLHDFYKNDRVAIIQGVDYPDHSYSHFDSADIWESGQPDISIDSGWLGRHLDRAGIGEGEMRGVGIGYELPLSLRGRVAQGDEITSLPVDFADGRSRAAGARHRALSRYGNHPPTEPLRRFAGQQASNTVRIVNNLHAEKPPPVTNNSLADALLTARTLLTGNYGVECAFVLQPGYDTHAGQVPLHEELLTQLDRGLEAMFFGTMAGTDLGVGPMDPHLASRLLVMTTSEFGRRIGEAGSAGVAGTDHGAAAPVFLIGPSGGALTPGLHGDHPDLGTPAAPADNLMLTMDLRRVYQTLLQDWFEDPDPGYGRKMQPIAGIFA